MIAQMADTAANDPLVQGNDEQGGMISPGEFSHKRNPIDMVQKGAKVGELTGGEVILNQSKRRKWRRNHLTSGNCSRSSRLTQQKETTSNGSELYTGALQRAVQAVR